ncbi:protease inhibitor I42 family protein [Streptomyces sp. NPDC017993]|uniref:protease inhibitor I42 family protein n=1 Tax=Streptomyces sp. NPDC017993 TaxID=3365027 RepID=UPI00378CAEC4
MGKSGIAKNPGVLVVIVALTALLVAVHSVLSQLSGPKVYDDRSTEIAVAPGERFAVRVADDPADGFRWIIAEPRPEPAVLKAAGGHFDADDPPPSGTGGSRYLDFTAVRAGRTDLRLLRCHVCGPGAADEAGARTLNFRVTVR